MPNHAEIGEAAAAAMGIPVPAMATHRGPMRAARTAQAGDREVGNDGHWYEAVLRRRTRKNKPEIEFMQWKKIKAGSGPKGPAGGGAMGGAAVAGSAANGDAAGSGGTAAAGEADAAHAASGNVTPLAAVPGPSWSTPPQPSS